MKTIKIILIIAVVSNLVITFYNFAYGVLSYKATSLSALSSMLLAACLLFIALALTQRIEDLKHMLNAKLEVKILEKLKQEPKEES